MASTAGLALVGTLGFASPSSAKPAEVTATWTTISRIEPCGKLTVTSDKDISNLVYRVDGEEHQIEFEDGVDSYVLLGQISDVWVKSGNNQSSGGQGQYFEQPTACDGDPGGPT